METFCARGEALRRCSSVSPPSGPVPPRAASDDGLARAVDGCAAPARSPGCLSVKGRLPSGVMRISSSGILRPDSPWTRPLLHHRHPVTPYRGSSELRGPVLKTILRGQLVFDEGTFSGPWVRCCADNYTRIDFTVSPITTHVLDTSLGRPAAGVPVVLAAKRRSEWVGPWSAAVRRTPTADCDRWSRLTQCSRQGHIDWSWIRARSLEHLATSQRSDPSVVVIIEIGSEPHYHVPLLLLSPFGYSTYRGT